MKIWLFRGFFLCCAERLRRGYIILQSQSGRLNMLEAELTHHNIINYWVVFKLAESILR